MKQILKLILIIIAIASFPPIEMVADSNVKKEIKALKKEYAQRQKEYKELIKYGVSDNVLQRKDEELAKLQEQIAELESNGSTSKNDKTPQSAAKRALVDACSAPSKIETNAVDEPFVDASVDIQRNSPSEPKKSNPNEEISLTVSSDGPTKDDALKNALRTAIEQAYGAFVSANTTILNDELVKDEIVTVSNGSIKDYKEISSFEKPDGSGYMMTVNATVSLPHLITYAKNHGSECEFAGNTFGMELKLFNLQKENELKVLYNAIPEIENLAKTTMTWNLHVDEPKIIDFVSDIKIKKGHDERYGSYGYEQATGVVSTTDVSFGYDGDFYLETEVNSLFNKQIKNHKGWLAVEKDDKALSVLNQMPNGQYALVRFKLSWLPNGDENLLADYLKSLFSSLSIDYKTHRKYEQQGHKLSTIPGLSWGLGPDTGYYIRNNQKDIDIWTDSVMTVLNRVKNNFNIVDNTGQKSSFNPFELSEWIYKASPDKYKKCYKYLTDREKRQLWNKHHATRLMNQNGAYINDWDTWNGSIVTNQFTSNNQKITTFKQTRHGTEDARVRKIISIGGEGLYNSISQITYLGEFLRPWDNFNAWGEEAVKTTWITYIFVPLSEISKYSSFKVVSTE